MELGYKNLCIIKHALQKSITKRNEDIKNSEQTGRNEVKEVMDEIRCLKIVTTEIDKYKN